MLQVPFIRDNKEHVIKSLKKRNFDASKIIAEVLEIDEQRRSLQTKLDNILAESNSLSKEIGILFKSGEKEKANQLKDKTSHLKEASKTLSEELDFKNRCLKSIITYHTKCSK